MSVLYQLTTAMQTQRAATLTDLFFAHVIVDIMEMELFAKVCICKSFHFLKISLLFTINNNSVDNCHKNSNCTDTYGSFLCTCDTGYTGNETFCQGELKTTFTAN